MITTLEGTPNINPYFNRSCAPSAWCGRWLPATLGWSPSDPHPSYQRCRRERRESPGADDIGQCPKPWSFA